MNCIKCKGPVLQNNYCSQCGVNTKYYKKAYNTSNYYYNQGLDKAQVRDLSSSIADLKTSLKYNKCNTSARNLLGLIYYEMGEVVLALSEWVVSNHFQPDNNDAISYLNAIQANPAKLDDVNQMIKKYNQTLVYVRQGSEDLALIQLKKVLTLSPNFVNGYLLLSLLYMNQGNKDKARKAVKRVLNIDAHNTLALKYIHELSDGSKDGMDAKETGTGRADRNTHRRELSRPDAKVNPTPVGKYRDPASGVRSFMNIVVGMVIAVIVMWILIIPSRTKSIEENYKKTQQTAMEDLQTKASFVDSLTEENKNLSSEVKALKKELETYTTDDGGGSVYDKLFDGISYYMDGDSLKAAQALKDVDSKTLESKTAKNMYKKISEETFTQASKTLYEQGFAKYEQGNYDESKTLLSDAYDLDDQNVNALYFLGRTYHQQGDTKQAKKLYQKVIDNFPGTSRFRDATAKIKEVS